MATPDIFTTDEDRRLYASIFDSPNGDGIKSRASLIEKKIEYLEGLTSTVSNRRTRRLLNDRLLMELVPRLSADEIRGLFAPPPWGDNVPVSPFCLTDSEEWDKFRSIDMDKEVSMMNSLKCYPGRKQNIGHDKMAVMSAWYRVDQRTREALRRSFLPDLIEGYENCIHSFIQEGANSEVLVLHVEDPFHRLLLHGVCEFYNLTSVTETISKGSKMVKRTSIRKKKSGTVDLPSISLSHFLKMCKEGIW